jgi:hypothetical protein
VGRTLLSADFAVVLDFAFAVVLAFVLALASALAPHCQRMLDK